VHRNYASTLFYLVMSFVHERSTDTLRFFTYDFLRSSESLDTSFATEEETPMRLSGQFLKRATS